MMEKTSAVLDRIHKIRKIKHRNIHDCAAFLNISKEGYLQFEQGSKWLSLPEMELLALYFGVSPAIFFQPDQWESERLKLLDDHIQPQFTKLRDKMILAKISSKSHEQSITLEEISEKTGLPQDDLNAYLNGEMSIPLDHLLKVSELIGLTDQDLLEPVWSTPADSNFSKSTQQWQPEYVSDKNQEQSEPSPFEELTLALQQLSKTDQAEVAKILLKKLQAIQNR